MPITLPRATGALLLVGLIAGCNGGPEKWAEDTCKTLPADAAGKAAGVAVATAEADSGKGEGYSGCNYTGKDGSMFSVQLRYDTTGTTKVDEAVAAVKSSDPAQTEVPMSKGKALWNPQLHALAWYPDDPRLITVTPPGAVKPDGTSDADAVLKPKAVALAEAAAK